MFDYDLFVIGAGSGGVRAARMAAQEGAKVAIAEEYRAGGTCVIRGCVPKKLMVYASHFSDAFEDAPGYGWSVGETSFDWAKMKAARDAEVSRLEGLYRKNLDAKGVAFIEGRAVLEDPHTVRVGDQGYSAKHILVATGGWPVLPDVPGIDHAITSNGFFELEEQPRRVAIVGGGYIGCEFACILNGLGSETHVIYRREQVLRGFDQDLRDDVVAGMTARGVRFHTNANVSEISKGDALTVTLTTGEQLEVDCVIYATGRAPNSKGLGLEDCGVTLKNDGAIKVDAFSRTSVPSIYAVGDVTDRVALTPVAIREAMAFVDTVFKGIPTEMDYDDIPTAVFTTPEMGTVGMTEDEAREHGEVEIYRTRFRPMPYVLAGRDERMMMKIIVAKDSRKVLGVHILGPEAGEMIQIAGIAVKMGATKEDFDRTCAVHPVAAEELVTMREPVSDT
ncbi:glutathione-disulfide reductase [Paracoccaceae bacterium GXU_MW_L88]